MSKVKNLNSEQIEDIKNLYLSKKSLKFIAHKYNLCTTTVSIILKQNGIIPTKKGYTSWCSFSKEKEIEIIKLYKQGYTQKEIASKFNTFNTSIRRVLLRNKVKIRGNSKIQTYCKHNPFKNNDEYSEYFLGLLLTDGCIVRAKNRNPYINLSLTDSDSYIIEAFRDWASPNQKIIKTFQKLNSSYMASVNITNEEAIEWLYRKGNFYNKSYDCKIYTPITWNIFRGIFDGDGGVHKTGKTDIDFFICGASKTFIEQIYRFLLKHNINAKFVCKGPDKWHKNIMYYVEIYKQEDVIKIGLNMYNNAHIFLKRKYEKWLAFYESKRAIGVNSGKEKAVQP